jgi:hypothetical protein
MDEIANRDPRAEIERLEARIDELQAKIESCRKFQLAARAAIALGGLFLAAGLLGVVSLDALGLTASTAAVLGGIVVAGSNGSTAKEAAGQLAEAAANRAAIIGTMQLRIVGDRATLH